MQEARPRHSALAALLVCVGCLLAAPVAWSQGYIWSGRLGGVGYDTGQSMVVDAAGNVYCVGDFSGSLDLAPGPDQDLVTGLVSELRMDAGFDRACDLVTGAADKRIVDVRPAPPVGDAYYYLARGTCAQPIGFGAASTLPDPHRSLPSGMVCP